MIFQIKNIIIRKLTTKYYVEITKPFDSLKELLEYYQTNTAQLNKAKFILKTPIHQQRWEFQHSDVQLGKLIGEGAYGEVREGTVKRRQQTLEVAVKLTKGTGEMSKAKIKEMMREARLIRNFKHRNIVRGAAQGVEYLHKQSCIHMDLAARNCLYSQDKVVKISDFGLSRLGVNYTIRSPRKLPIKWLAPETIATFTFSLKTDVFSYGVMVYEIFTNGKEPWDGYSNAEVKKGVSGSSLEGKQLTLPDSCPEEFRNFVRDRVYVKDPSARATMTEGADNEKSVFERFVAESPPKVKVDARTGGGDDMKESKEAAEGADKMKFKKSKGFHRKPTSRRR
ncbi:protein tyrosine kinase [Cooperia oncophora]